MIPWRKFCKAFCPPGRMQLKLNIRVYLQKCTPYTEGPSCWQNLGIILDTSILSSSILTKCQIEKGSSSTVLDSGRSKKITFQVESEKVCKTIVGEVDLTVMIFRCRLGIFSSYANWFWLRPFLVVGTMGFVSCNFFKVVILKRWK